MSLLVILAEHDIGFSLFLFVVFLVMLWVTTGRLDLPRSIGLVLFARRHLRRRPRAPPGERPDHGLARPVEATPSDTRLPADPGRARLRPRRALRAPASGSGDPGDRSRSPTSDFIFAALGEELGLFGTAAIVVGYLLLVGSGLRAALRARSEFAKLAALGLTCVLGFQAFFIMAGVVRLLPLTGVTLPFVSYGGRRSSPTTSCSRS